MSLADLAALAKRPAVTGVTGSVSGSGHGVAASKHAEKHQLQRGVTGVTGKKSMAGGECGPLMADPADDHLDRPIRRPDRLCSKCLLGLYWRFSVLSGGPGPWLCHTCEPPNSDDDWIDACAVPVPDFS
jgi:hypothetical protein